MNKINKKKKNKLIAITLKRNRILGKLGLLPMKTESWGSLKNIFNILNSSEIDIQLHKEDAENKDYIFSIIKTLEKNGVKITITEFDKIFSNADIENIGKISKTAKINFRYVYPNYTAADNISSEMDIQTYLKIFDKIKYLTKVATSNFTKKEEQVIFIANQLSEYVKYDFEYDQKSQKEFMELSSLQGCLEGKKTVCAGVALAFERCMSEIGIENMLTIGYSGDNEDNSKVPNNHVWNKVKINGKWYNVDVTYILENPKAILSKEDLVKIFILSSDKTFRLVGNFINNNTNIPVSEENFPDTTEIYRKISKAKNVLAEYDKGNRNTFLQYGVENNNTSLSQPIKQPQELSRN